MGVFETVVISYIIYMAVALYGITRGYHRYFSHREFNTSTVQETLMLYCGLLCGVRSPLAWAGVHRMHHAYSDTELDPHSPILMPKWRVFFSVYKVPTIPRKFIQCSKPTVCCDEILSDLGLLTGNRNSCQCGCL